MSTRATLYIHWRNWEMDVKLYHHWDWYVDYLWEKLAKALEKWRKWKLKDQYWSNSKTLIECVAEVGGWELAFPIHWDVEYIYHIYHECKWNRNQKKNKYEILASYKLECQAWMEYWEENVSKRPPVILAMNWDWKKKKLDSKQAELELGNKEKFIPEYFNS